jgi:hypothetical protein
MRVRCGLVGQQQGQKVDLESHCDGQRSITVLTLNLLSTIQETVEPSRTI